MLIVAIDRIILAKMTLFRAVPRAEAKLACILYSRPKDEFQVAVISNLGRVIDQLELTPGGQIKRSDLQ